MDGLFIENGPFRVSAESSNPSDASAPPTIQVNPYSWHNSAYMLFLDQPLGVGYSIVNPNCPWCDYVHNHTAVNEHMYSALQSLMHIYPFLQHREIYISGESYAGHYIPSMVDYILSVGPVGEHRGHAALRVSGMAIGNGWSDPKVQYNFAEFAHNIGEFLFLFVV